LTDIKKQIKRQAPAKDFLWSKRVNFRRTIEFRYRPTTGKISSILYGLLVRNKSKDKKIKKKPLI
jgi:hypothetical protein